MAKTRPAITPIKDGPLRVQEHEALEGAMTNNATVYVVDDDDTVCRTLAAWLSKLGMNVRTFADATAFFDGYSEETPSCLVADLKMPTMEGLALQRRLRERGIDIPTIFLTQYGTVESAVEAMQGGAVSFLEKPYEHDVLLANIRKALKKDEKETGTRQRLKAGRERLESLTRRQHEVLERVVQGKANKVIALELGLSEKTVELHRAKMMKGMGATSVAELVRTWVELKGS